MVPESRERVDVGVVEVGAVVDRGESQLGGQPDARAGAELVGVQPAPQPLGLAGGEHGAGLVGVEGAGLAEHVDPAGVRGGGLEHRTGDQVDVAGRVLGVLGGHDVRTEERRLVGELPRHGEAARLVEDGQPVAALDLDGRRALAAHLGDEAGDVRGELLVGGLAGGGDGGADPARGVRRPGHPGRELRRPVAREDQVAVAVDEPGDDRAARRVDARVGGRRLGGAARPRRRCRPRRPARRRRPARAGRRVRGRW